VLGDRLRVLFLALLFLPALAAGQQVTLQQRDGAVEFAVIGDSGTGSKHQYELAEKLVAAHEQFPFTFVLMMGDNMYGGDGPKDYQKKFELPYKPLLDAGIPFYATLGNHDDPNQRFYKLFNMDGKRYYTFSKGDVQFFVIDSTYMDKAQLTWLEQELARSGARWKIVYGHHPLYSSGARHGSEVDLRVLVEPLFIKYGVDAVFAGHEHFYERVKPQNGIYYFTSGAAGKLRENNIRRGPLTAAGFDDDMSFMLVSIDDDKLAFQVISRTGQTVDSGEIDRPADPGQQTAPSQPDTAAEKPETAAVP
jgi:predicted phosphodiesterase